MKSLKLPIFATFVALFVPLTAGAFGFGATNDDYYGPWGPYGPYGPYGGQPPQGYPPPMYTPQNVPPYGPPPGSRDVRGMWGSGPLMKWGGEDSRSRKKEPEAKPYERLREPWQWHRPWTSRYWDQPARGANQAGPAPQQAAPEPPPPTDAAPSVRPNLGAGGSMPPGWERYQNAPQR